MKPKVKYGHYVISSLVSIYQDTDNRYKYKEPSNLFISDSYKYRLYDIINVIDQFIDDTDLHILDNEFLFTEITRANRYGKIFNNDLKNSLYLTKCYITDFNGDMPEDLLEYYIERLKKDLEPLNYIDVAYSKTSKHFIIEIMDYIDIMNDSKKKNISIKESSWNWTKYFPSEQEYSIDPKDYFDNDFSSTVQYIKDTFNNFDFTIVDSSFVTDHTSTDDKRDKLCLVLGFNENGSDEMPEDIANNYERHLKSKLKNCPKELGNIIEVKIEHRSNTKAGLLKVSGMVDNNYDELSSVAYIWFDGDMTAKKRKEEQNWKDIRSKMSPEAIKRVQDIWNSIKNESKNIKKFEEYILVYQGVNYGPVYNIKKIGQGNGQLMYCTVTNEWYDPTQVQDIFNRYVIKCRQNSEDPMYSSSEAITQSNIDWIMEYIENED